MKNIFYLLPIVFLISCTNNKIKKPDNFIEKDKMVDLILDMKIAQKARTVKNIEKKKNQNYLTIVFEKYQIDSTQFKENNDYYTENLEIYHEIYKQVEMRLKDSVKKYTAIKTLKDSLNNEKKKKKNAAKQALKKKQREKNKKRTIVNRVVKAQ